MIMKILSTILLTLLIVLGACTSPQVSPDPFVRVSNGRLTVNGKPYYYIGTNFEGENNTMDTMIYDVTSADSAYEWVLKLLDISGDELIDKYILEFDSNNDAFIESQLKKIKIWDIENTNQ